MDDIDEPVKVELYDKHIKPESETYIKNKQLEIIEYNNKLEAYKNRSLVGGNFDLKLLERQRDNIIIDLSIRPGIVYDELFDTYVIPVEIDLYKDLTLNSPTGSSTIIRFQVIKNGRH